ncbi:Putative ribonuclease H protein At1g65750, partial [Linum perenne]
NGLVRIGTGEAAAGGCTRDADGKVVDAFSANLGKCSITHAEITGIVLGFERVWDAGIRRVEVQTDSKCAIQLLSYEGGLSNQHAAILGKFRRLKRRDWIIQLKHVYREANFLADHLANQGHDLALGVQTISATDTRVSYWAIWLEERRPALCERNNSCLCFYQKIGYLIILPRYFIIYI